MWFQVVSGGGGGGVGGGGGGGGGENCGGGGENGGGGGENGENIDDGYVANTVLPGSDRNAVIATQKTSMYETANANDYHVERAKQVFRVTHGLYQVQQRFEPASIKTEPLASILAKSTLILGTSPIPSTTTNLICPLNLDLDGVGLVLITCMLRPDTNP